MNVRHRITHALVPCLVLLAQASLAGEPTADQAELARGKYILQTSGCHDCHTPGYPETGGQVPVEGWLTGSPVGFQGPWGTSYPANLRLSVQGLDEAQWLIQARRPMRPPMPWFGLRDMTDADLVAVYRYIRSLGPAGEPAPVAAPPGAQVSTPYFDFVPRNLPPQTASQP